MSAPREIPITLLHANAYYQRGLAKEKLGLKKSTIQNYRKAVALNPNLWQAKKRLRWLGVNP